MRISSISDWSLCEAMALHAPPRQAGRTNVAAFVGTTAHAFMVSPVLKIDTPERIAWDALTPSMHHAKTQAVAIAEYASKLLTDSGWGVLEREEELRRDELIGHLDIRAYHHDYGEAIIDLKTGAQVGAAWLQCGGYIHLSNDVTTPMGGVLHVPRVAISKDVKGSLEFRDGLALEMAWVRNHSRIAEIIEDNEGPTYSPGYHCGRCHLADCAVRVVEAK